ncbi:tRNA-dihydrouridine synthase family protein [Patescibacteria group bacterium]|nr:tRNA-dihydrouridine synthase family protein [Patescibacteria group bacterium]
MNFWTKLEKPILSLAPMCGITDSAFRQICKKHGADVVYSEMASVDALYYKKSAKKTLDLVKFQKLERPYVVQLFGKDPAKFAKAVEIITQQVKPDGIDINFGCPAKKVFGHGSGASLMNDTKKANQIIKSVIQNTTLPVSIKIRSEVKGVTAVNFLNSIDHNQLSALMIHGRTYNQGFFGSIDYTIIKQVKSLLDIPVLANGGINTPEEAKLMFDKTNADGIGLARGVKGKPWLFSQIKDFLVRDKYNEKNFKQIKKIILEHAKLSQKEKGEHGIVELRKHLTWYIKGFEGAKELRQELVRVNSIMDITKILSMY